MLLVFAVLNGALRETVIAPWMDDEAAHAVSTVILSAAVFAVALLTIRWIGPNGRRDAVLVGIMWLVLTIAFEFFAGHFLFGASWETLLGDYNILRGRKTSGLTRARPATQLACPSGLD